MAELDALRVTLKKTQLNDVIAEKEEYYLEVTMMMYILIIIIMMISGARHSHIRMHYENFLINDDGNL
jgi:hypothetical protein